MAKATFYHHFPTKEELVLAYLDEVDTVWTGQLHGRRERRRVASRAAGGHVRALTTACRRSGYRGCAFINAAGEYEVGTPCTPARWRTRTPSEHGCASWPCEPEPRTPTRWRGPDPAARRGLASGSVDGSPDATVVAQEAARVPRRHSRDGDRV